MAAAYTCLLIVWTLGVLASQWLWDVQPQQPPALQVSSVLAGCCKCPLCCQCGKWPCCLWGCCMSDSAACASAVSVACTAEHATLRHQILGMAHLALQRAVYLPCTGHQALTALQPQHSCQENMRVQVAELLDSLREGPHAPAAALALGTLLADEVNQERGVLSMAIVGLRDLLSSEDAAAQQVCSLRTHVAFQYCCLAACLWHVSSRWLLRASFYLPGGTLSGQQRAPALG